MQTSDGACDDEPEWLCTVHEKVGRREHVPPASLPPVSDSVDPEAITDLITAMDEIQITFEYYGYYVTIHGNGTVLLSEGPLDTQPDDT